MKENDMNTRIKKKHAKATQMNKMNEQKLARKGTLKRKQQIRDLLSVIDNET